MERIKALFMKGGAMSRKLKAAETKRRIYESAVALMKMRGLDNFSVEDIAAAAGVSKGTFYVHYKSKFSLIADYVSTIDIDYPDCFNSIPPDIKPSEMLLLATEKITHILACNIGINVIRTVYEALIKKADGSEALLGHDRKLHRIYRRIIRQGVRQGEFREELKIDSVASHCVISLRGMTHEWCIRHPDFDLMKEVLQHFEIILKGIKNS
jgi:AcrR family transcriptional regulator